MPTPFTHLHAAQRLLDDPLLPEAARGLLAAQRPAFLLGSVAADARIAGGTRADTHFYAYDEPFERHPWRVMTQQHPALCAPADAAQRAFVAGYVAHLCMDEIWSLAMLAPYFAGGTWLTANERFFMLHIILIYMDERDYGHLAGWQRPALLAAQPAGWLRFMPDIVLCDWRDFIAGQLPPGESRTLAVFGGRIQRSAADFRAMLDTPAALQANLWDHVPPDALAAVEARMYAFAREQMQVYLEEAELGTA
jgi:hypothetical protein